MKTPAKLLIVAGLVAAVVAAVALKRARQPESAKEPATGEIAAPSPGPTIGAAAAAKLPKLLDLGAGKCIPCKLMAPILEQLKKEYAGRMQVEFIDVWENPEAGKRYGVEMIPTQIFYGPDGEELFRHTGFFGKEDILGKWKELGVEIGGSGAAAAKPSSAIVREVPLAADTRPRAAVCSMCDGDVDPKSKVLVEGATERRVLCSPHCYLIYLSSIVDPDMEAEQSKVTVTDWSDGKPVVAEQIAKACKLGGYKWGRVTPMIAVYLSTARASCPSW